MDPAPSEGRKDIMASSIVRTEGEERREEGKEGRVMSW